jgi:hypothetical protein
LEQGLLWHLLAAVLLFAASVAYFKLKRTETQFDLVWRPFLLATLKNESVKRSLVVRAIAIAEQNFKKWEGHTGSKIELGSNPVFEVSQIKVLMKVAVMNEDIFFQTFPHVKGFQFKVHYKEEVWNVEPI